MKWQVKFKIFRKLRINLITSAERQILSLLTYFFGSALNVLSNKLSNPMKYNMFLSSQISLISYWLVIIMPKKVYRKKIMIDKIGCETQV